MLRRSVVVLAFTLLITLVVSIPAQALTVSDIEKELICQCGCIMVVAPCDCGTAEEMRALIRQKIDQGQTKAQILDYFLAQYGEKVLAAPTKQGFNLTVWVIPFVAIAAGAVAIYFILRAWVWKGKVQPETEAPQSEEVTQAYRKRFQEEFERFREEETPK